jgi:hypothetical protein
MAVFHPAGLPGSPCPVVEVRVDGIGIGADHGICRAVTSPGTTARPEASVFAPSR